LSGTVVQISSGEEPMHRTVSAVRKTL